MKFVIDQSIPFMRGIFEQYAKVVYKEGGEISHEDLLDADALIIRTRTHCDRALLEGTPVKIIATATIGTDHIDAGYCDANKICVDNAAGCNAGGVMDYVFSALYGIADLVFDDDDNVFDVTIDKPEGDVDLADCEYVHRAVLSEFDRNIEDYALTVGSAGIDASEADELLKTIKD